jgi:hypothetical protein
LRTSEKPAERIEVSRGTTPLVSLEQGDTFHGFFGLFYESRSGTSCDPVPLVV